MRIIILTKKEKFGAQEAIEYAREKFDEVEVISGGNDDEFPKRLYDEHFDILISYISPWIVPKSVLERTKQWNINFHPGPPEYPGIGCFNFALYESAKEFGATAHLMESKVDTGRIIGVRRLPISSDETVLSLSLKTYSAQYSLFIDIVDFISSNNSLPVCSEDWKRKPTTRKELEDLATIKPAMSQEEIANRIRATYYPDKPAPFIDIGGYRFEYNPER